MTTTGTKSHPTDDLRDDLAAVVDTVREGVKKKASEMVEHGRESADRLKTGLTESVQERPLTSLLIAGGVGLMLGLYLGRRH